MKSRIYMAEKGHNVGRYIATRILFSVAFSKELSKIFLMTRKRILEAAIDERYIEYEK